jgi:hypothetical protein
LEEHQDGYEVVQSRLKAGLASEGAAALGLKGRKTLQADVNARDGSLRSANGEIKSEFF